VPYTSKLARHLQPVMPCQLNRQTLQAEIMGKTGCAQKEENNKKNNSSLGHPWEGCPFGE